MTYPDDPLRQPRFVPVDQARDTGWDSFPPAAPGPASLHSQRATPLPPTSIRAQRATAPQHRPERARGRGLRITLSALGVIVAFGLGGAAMLLWQGHPLPWRDHTLATSAPIAPAEPATAARVQKAADAYFGFYAAGQYATTYQLLSPSARATVRESTWAGAYQACINHSTQLAYDVSQPEVSGTTGVVRVAIQGALSKLGSEEASFTYSGGRWWYVPPNMSAFQGHTTAQAVVALKAAKLCS